MENNIQNIFSYNNYNNLHKSGDLKKHIQESPPNDIKNNDKFSPEELPENYDSEVFHKTGPSDQAIKPHKQWLFINYMAADSDLADYQMNNLDRQEIVGSDEKTHVVSYIDIGQQKTSFGDWKGCRAYYVTQDHNKEQINSELIKDYGDVDMSNSKTLTRFVTDAIQKYPSDHICLIINSHGYGSFGVTRDTGHNSIMNIPALKEALVEAQKKTGKKLDIIGFDACLMAQTEVAYELRDTANIMFGSEELERGNGLDYVSLLNLNKISELQKPSNMNRFSIQKALAKEIVDSTKNNKNITTFSAISLNGMEELKGAIDSLAKAMEKETKIDKTPLINAFRKADSFGDNWFPFKDFRDLGDLVDKVIQEMPTLKNEAMKVKENLNKVILNNQTNKNVHPNSQGLTIYAPTNRKHYLIEYNNLSFALNTKWNEMLCNLNEPENYRTEK